VITLLTAPPGNGKTLYLVTKLVKEFHQEVDNGDGTKTEVPRPVYYFNIPELALPWLKIDNPREWQKLPAGAIVVVDEAQHVWPKRPAGAKVPDDIAAMTTHRHQGIDFVLITQSPKLIDSYVCELVGRHLALFRALGWHRATLYRWDEYMADWRTRSARRDALKSNFRFPKDGYKLYKSSELHTHKPTVPLIFWSLPLLVGLLWFGWHNLSGVLDRWRNPTKQGEDIAKASTFSKPGQPVAATKTPAVDVADPAGISQRSKAAFSASGAGSNAAGLLPWTDERFAKLVEPKRAPTPAGCVVRSGGEACVCYTEDATVLQVDPKFCSEFVAGRVFAYWRETASKPGAWDGAPAKDTRPAKSAPPARTSASEPLTVSAPSESVSISIPPGAPVTRWRSSEWAVPPQYQ